MRELSDFINDELLPRVLRNMDTIFPERRWTKRGSRWSSPFHTDGSESQSGASERSYIKIDSNYCYSVGETDGGPCMSLINYALIYKGYAQGAKGQAFIDTVKWLCDEVHIEMPQYNSEEYEKYKQRVDTIEAMYRDMQKALFTKEGKEVLTYLTDVRGSDIELIKKMGLGFISSEMADRINREKLPLSFNPSKNKAIAESTILSLPYGVGRTHQLAIPYMCDGHIRGFKFREIKENFNKDGRPLNKYYNNNGLPKGQYLFGFRGFRLSGNGAKDRDLTIVEGELDALHAQVLGLDNVVAAAGGEFDEKVIDEARAKGVTRITLLFDTEESEEKQESTYKKIEKAIEKVRKNGLKAFYAALPSEPGKKMDVDDFLRCHPIEELEDIIKDALPASYYLFMMRLNTFLKQQEVAGALSFKNLDEFMIQAIELANSEYTTPVERDMIFRKFEECTGSKITKEVIKAEADNIQTAAKASASGIFSPFFKGANKERIRKLLVARGQNLSSGYHFGSEELMIPPKALTFIAAATGHCKSTYLINLALNVCAAYPEKKVLFLSYEEALESVYVNMLNTYANIELGLKNRNIIANHTIADGDLNMLPNVCPAEYEDYRHFLENKQAMSEFAGKEADFYTLIEENRLNIQYVDFAVDTLSSYIIEMRRKGLCDIAFIDYVQLLNAPVRSKYRSREDELKEICVNLKNLAVDENHGLPIIFGAQFNRLVKSAKDLLTTNIGEAGDIERIANTIVALWNCQKTEDQGTPEKNKEIALYQGTKEYNSSAIFAKILKSRGVASGLTATFPFEGNTGRILDRGDAATKEIYSIM